MPLSNNEPFVCYPLPFAIKNSLAPYCWALKEGIFRCIPITKLPVYVAKSDGASNCEETCFSMPYFNETAINILNKFLYIESGDKLFLHFSERLGIFLFL